MKELKADHQNGRISDEKYKELSRQYMIKLKNIDASSRIRAMQGRKQRYSSSNQTHNNIRPDKRAAELSRLEDEKLVQKYIVNPKRSSNNQRPRSHGSNSGKWSVIAIVFLIIAFTAGIGFGMLNFDFKATNISNASAIVTDSAFPAEINNNTTVNTTLDSSSVSSSSSSGTLSSDTSSTSTSSSDSGSSDSGGSSDGGGSSDSGSSDSGGSSDGGGSSDSGAN
ncbi:hypothetical protein BGI41_07540 [Methanobrevibacter sp. 87.7]|uniref:hypothetical protein n=1 Tax=Methanobrevibacter sp. 87.7 TaxID=387957 RepID=UPI000B511F96|nr:hypothetical protein [Methanobrevibacter sp. 87.7]OWT32459.1 hypothetical protein BGI41_07540 [Methanobrevibacter sp. 87.7]